MINLCLQGQNLKESHSIDKLSHHILRLAYCGKPELRKWFLSMECELFKLRFENLLESDMHSHRVSTE